MKPTELKARVETCVEDEILPVLMDFVRIPNLSRNFDKDHHTNGLHEKACQFCMDWGLQQGVKGLKLEIVHHAAPGTPVLFGTIDASEGCDSTVMMYGHIDKQPHLLSDWREGLHPTEPVREGDWVYGRGISDDGYAFFASIMIAKMLQEMGAKHPKFVLFFECDEESGSKYIIDYVDELRDRIGNPNLIFCLDSGAVDYDHWCLTSTLRGGISWKMTSQILEQSTHSGLGSGIIPDQFRVLRDRLNVIEDLDTGNMHDDFQKYIPAKYYTDAEKVVDLIGTDVQGQFPRVEGTKPTNENAFECYLNGTLKPQLTTIGVSGLPDCAEAGNVLNKTVSMSCSLRLSPFQDPVEAQERATALLTKNVPYDAKFELDWINVNPGFYAPVFPPHLDEICGECAQEAFGTELVYMHCGGSIPFMGKLKEKFCDSHFMVTGVLGPGNNAHAGNENLNVEYFKKFMVAVVRFCEKSAPVNWNPDLTGTKKRLYTQQN